MTKQRTAGILMIVGMLLTIVASVVFPGAYYGAKTDAERQAIIDANQSGWMLTHGLWVIATALTLGGLVFVALRNGGLLGKGGAGLFAFGCLFWLAYVILRWTDPSQAMARLWMETVFVALTAVGLLLIGIGFFKEGFSKWLGVVNAIYAVLILGSLAVSRGEMIQSFPPQALYLVTLLTGIVAAKRG